MDFDPVVLIPEYFLAISFLIRKTFGLLLRMMKHTLVCSHILFGKDMVTGEVRGYVTRLHGGFAG